MTLDRDNTFNTLLRNQQETVLQEGTTQYVNMQDERQGQGKPVGWDILWQHIQAHYYGCKGLLKYFHDGKVAYILVFSRATRLAAFFSH